MDQKRKLYIETYGCQMNFSDTQIVGSIMTDHNFETTGNIAEADLIFVNTCSIRDNAEKRVRARLQEFKRYKKQKPGLIIGVLGCMAERLKEQLISEEKMVDVIVGPDAYRDLPRLLNVAEGGQKAINVILSADETYADINPVRLDSNGVSAFISIMRGCENFCSYCVVPYTRGRERSRDPLTIVKEAGELFSEGYREVTLLGQNVNSYKWDDGTGFSKLLERVAKVNPLLRVRFATSHPKDLTDELLHTMAAYPNICRSIHLPVQSGSDRILKLMNRKYDSSWYRQRIEAIRKILPGCAISTDIITGFCSETDQDHRDTLDMMNWVAYDYAFMFKYSERPDTLAHKKYKDDVPEEVKSVRLQEIINLQQELSFRSNHADIGKTFEVLAESVSRKSGKELSGRNSQNKVVVFPKKDYKPGDYINVKVNACTPATLKGEVI
ncbi:tRNA (N6-isopentenyl adenosine(37)-C2)-methylthiotransferase MiaB [Lentimicrobium sp.]|uniref:tRNA (N6-isopentenyl adenosine(37)-C2)-methylthiotransferase MiaB n=1 Tax=Lentimicrobium sp. TaxID=2034841 RepID=UPI002C3D9D5F|nr:tRNA (N6-isopentenyl adenosine(37)-C2)-methylthiotransferase MiaB [Lentimicrobium sp.]HPF64207.1 tRNA (N6-isopentenyl adenosine(37)-C2)-methylthiotransferase MiaB [Lentimicrobium sp.]HPJ61307.1 tRNA (N6-isopentenyl adenosine(37)-C2)-methylthiotransferase MiaB [Lentimicrobium sp.]HRW68845.1 tRNA (N6-isopentenyl adenosine(37)-C2)-methylthiotransferase MiaB [Lentimicrobium sp.]